MVEIDHSTLRRMVALGLSVNEMAVLFGCSPGTIRNRLKTPIKGVKTDSASLSDEGIKLLCVAIVRQAIRDLKKRKKKHDTFFDTEWCDELLYGAGIHVTGQEIEREVANDKRKD